MQGLSALTHLTALTKMMFERIDLNDAAMKHIGACTRLRDLTIQTEAFPVTPLTVADMMSLTQLTGLTRLDLSIEFEDDQLNEELVSLPRACLHPAITCSDAGCWDFVSPLL